jgi:hypothetical protein
LDVEKMGFSTEMYAAAGFWVITINPVSITCYDPREEVLVISDFIKFLAHKHTLLFLLIC